MNRTTPVYLSLCIHSGPPLEKVFKQFLYKYQYQSILEFSVIWLGMIRIKFHIFGTDMGIWMM